MNTPLLKHFTLLKVKKVKGGGLEINYEIMETTGTETYYDSNTVKSSKEPHPDLTGLLNSLATYVGKIMNLDVTEKLVNAKEFEASPSQKEYGKTMATELMSRIVINGISVHGRDDKKSIKVLAVYSPDVYQALAINPQIRFGTEKYGFEEDIEAIIEKIESECFEYIFEDKKAQLTLAFDD